MFRAATKMSIDSMRPASTGKACSSMLANQITRPGASTAKVARGRRHGENRARESTPRARVQRLSIVACNLSSSAENAARWPRDSSAGLPTSRSKIPALDRAHDASVRDHLPIAAGV